MEGGKIKMVWPALLKVKKCRMSRWNAASYGFNLRTPHSKPCSAFFRLSF
jgi:hypothetical protein